MASITPLHDRTYDLAIFGATGFTGTLIAKHLAAAAPKDVKWAITGRSASKLEKLRDELSKLPDLTNSPDVIAFSDRSAKEIINDSRVVLSVIGPSTLYAEDFLKLAVEAGTGWVDLNGETAWLKNMIVKYGEQAKETGAVIIPSAGYDCIPSELSLLTLALFAGPNLKNVKAVMEDQVGTYSAGTFNSMIAVFETFSRDEIFGPTGYLSTPYYCSSDLPASTLASLPKQEVGANAIPIDTPQTFFYSETNKVKGGGKLLDAQGGALGGLGYVEQLNRNLVFRGISLSRHLGADTYNPNLQYREYHLVPPTKPSMFGASALTSAKRLSNAFANIIPWVLSSYVLRRVLAFFVARLIGENGGPDEDMRENKGYLRWRDVGDVEITNQDGTVSEKKAYSLLKAHKDGGYGWTSIVVSETALYLALKLKGAHIPEVEDSEKALLPGKSGSEADLVFRNGKAEGGFWTTACLGLGLVRYLVGRKAMVMEAGWVKNTQE
ncbi:hypothetical protein BJ508DRAFT_223518 [Ascobolus immersus RN42]|uniref:Uncharacterized protein n=1 Tax=Ascobolus immersus RN42 TaxID=1160509 RepID=A0A3N4IDK4_ASCIM|nr:hypothetical protein BJ508DRAFT_223518 [Ascobolus immersus RN42]